jgi:AhpD family alkylhydroperoxidase
MSRIPPVREEDASPEAQAALARVRRLWGRPWNVTGVLAHVPSVLHGFLDFWQGIDQSELSAVDREIICLEMAWQNGCHYCIPAHRFTAPLAGLEPHLIEALVAGQPCEEGSRAEVVQRLVRRMVAVRGELGDQEFRKFQEQGISVAQMIAAVAEIAHCTLTNYVNRLADTPLDPFLVEGERKRASVRD